MKMSEIYRTASHFGHAAIIDSNELRVHLQLSSEEIYRTASHFGHAANLEMIAFAMAFAHGNTFLERQPQATAVALEREGATPPGRPGAPGPSAGGGRAAAPRGPRLRVDAAREARARPARSQLQLPD